MELSISVVSSNKSLSKAMRKLRPELNNLFGQLNEIDEESPLDGVMCLIFVDGIDGQFESKNKDGTFYLEYAFNCPPTLSEIVTKLWNAIPRCLSIIIKEYKYAPEDEKSYIRVVDEYFV